MLTFEDQYFLIQLVNHFILYFGVLVIVLYVFYQVSESIRSLSDKAGNKMRKSVKTAYLKYKTMKVSTIEK